MPNHGKGGRLPISDEVFRYNVRQKAWKVCDEALSTNKLSYKDKASMAQAIATKDMTQQVDVKGDMLTTFVMTVPEGKE